MIFEMAVYKPSRIMLYFDRFGDYSGSGMSTRIRKWALPCFAPNLPQVCRQIYAETATLIHRVNRLSFATERGLKKWLSKRLPAELEAIEHLELLDRRAEELGHVFQELKDGPCINLRSLTQNEKTANTVRYRSEVAEEFWMSGCDTDCVSTDDEIRPDSWMFG